MNSQFLIHETRKTGACQCPSFSARFHFPESSPGIIPQLSDRQAALRRTRSSMLPQPALQPNSVASDRLERHLAQRPNRDDLLATNIIKSSSHHALVRIGTFQINLIFFIYRVIRVLVCSAGECRATATQQHAEFGDAHAPRRTRLAASQTRRHSVCDRLVPFASLPRAPTAIFASSCIHRVVLRFGCSSALVGTAVCAGSRH